MCGIAGYFNLHAGGPARRAFLDRSLRLLRRRGPDSEGSHAFNRAGLAHTRLSIIDLSSNAAQPFLTPDGRCAIVFNGEIYNYVELRRSLRQLGHAFRSESDTEVILNGYLQWGEDVVERLQGMFAFALWDERAQSLLLARDRLGKKPLFLRETDDCIYFGSTADVVLGEDAAPALNPRALYDYFSLAYIPGRDGIHEGVERMAPATILTLGADNSRRTRRFWDPLEHIEEDYTRLPADLDPTLREAVRCRSRADVPIGVFLSGGLDSACVTSYLREMNLLDPLRSYVVDFPEGNFSERSLSERSAARYDTEHHSFQVPTAAPDFLRPVAQAWDEPFADTSMVPMYYLSEYARKSITVAYTGDGGDECFGGYITHQADGVYAGFSTLPTFVQRAVAAATLAVLPGSHQKLSLSYKARRFFGAIGASPAFAHYWWRVVTPPAEMAQILHPDLLRDLGDYSPFRHFEDSFARAKSHSFLKQAMYVDTQTWLRDDILVKADRASMAHGLELRAPFLDHRVVEFAFGLPSRELATAFNGKIFLKRALAGRVAPEVLLGRKQGFSAPFSYWLAGPLKSWMLDTLAAAKGSAPFLNFDGINTIVERHCAGREDRSYQLWSVLSFLLWRQGRGEARPGAGEAA